MTDSDTLTFRADHQLIVLEAINEKCGLLGKEPVRLDVAQFEGETTSYYCAVLTKLGYIESTSLQELGRELTYPVCITLDGQRMRIRNFGSTLRRRLSMRPRS